MYNQGYDFELEDVVWKTKRGLYKVDQRERTELLQILNAL